LCKKSKQQYWIEEQYLDEVLIGRSGKYVEQVRPGPHTWDGSYTELDLVWEQMDIKIQTATQGDDLVVLITPNKQTADSVKLIIEPGMLWNKPGNILKEEDYLLAMLSEKNIGIYPTGDIITDCFVETLTPYLVVSLDETVGISTGIARTLDEIKKIVSVQKETLRDHASRYGDLAEAYIAVQAGIAWNTIYEPKFERVVSTVGRLWNEEYGGFCLFGWDNFFLAYMTSLDNHDLAIANIVEHMRSLTPEGFIPNDDRGNGSKSFDRSQPPVGGIMVWEVYKKYPELWYLEACFDGLFSWNRWWIEKRMNEGLLSYGSHQTINPYNESHVHDRVAAGYESGMDDSPMYIDVPFSKEKNTLELQDVGLNSLYVADCRALAKMAKVLGKKKEEKELNKRAAMISEQMENLWSEDLGLYLNKNTATGKLSKRLSPTLFYPLLAQIPGKEKAQRMIEDHLMNPEEFYGEWMLPSIARNDSLFFRQRYWKGAIWPPLNFLTYLSLRQYGFEEAGKDLSDKSLKLIMNEWKRKGYVSENYSSITGTGDDERLSSDRFHSWGALFGIISFIEAGYFVNPMSNIQYPKTK